MKSITADTPGPLTPLSILLIGPPGGGKSTFLLGFPDLVVLDCDLNLDGPTRFLKAAGRFKPYSYEAVGLYDSGEPVDVADCFDRLLDLMDDVKNTPAKWGSIDSLTHVNEYIVRKVLKEQKNASLMQPQYWGPFKSHLLSLLVGKIRGCGKHVIATVHETDKEEAVKGGNDIFAKRTVARNPSIQGGIAHILGGFFTDMWRLSSERAPGGLEFKLECNRTHLDNLKNSLGITDDILNPSYEKLLPYLTKAGYV